MVSTTETTNPIPPSTAPYPSAILLSTFSLLLSLLILPPMLWHLTNRNIGATSLIAWLLLLNLQDFLNAILWPHDDISAWYDGQILCDIEVKILVASWVGVPASVACILRALARVMDTEKATLGLSRGRRRWEVLLELGWCVGLPLLQMPAHYVVQSRRYYLVGIAGCLPAVSDSWVTDGLLIAPPIVWALVGGCYASLVLIRLHRYRRNFTTLLANSNTDRSRFARLFGICIVWLAVSIPVQAYVISQQAATEHIPFSWSEIHDPAAWKEVIRQPSGGRIVYTRYIWLGAAFMVFIFFGFGRDATRMYAKGFRAVGLGRCLPCVREQPAGRNPSHAGTVSSVGSRARLLFGRRSHAQSLKSWGTESRSSKGTASSEFNEPLSPRTMQHLETVRENPGMADSKVDGITSQLPVWLGGRRRMTASDVEKGLAFPENGQTSSDAKFSFYRLTSPFRSMAAVHGAESEPVSMNNIMRRQDITIHSTVAAGRSTPSDSTDRRHATQDGVMVKKEVRQGSEIVGNGI